MKQLTEEINVVEELARIHEQEAERRRNPLAGYSTLQLKRELRRRKKQNIRF